MTHPALFINALRGCLEANADQDGALDPFIEALRDVAPVPTGCVMDDLKHTMSDGKRSLRYPPIVALRYAITSDWPNGAGVGHCVLLFAQSVPIPRRNVVQIPEEQEFYASTFIPLDYQKK